MDGDNCLTFLPLCDGCGPRPRLVTAIWVRRGRECGLVFNSTGDDAETFVELPEYAARLAIQADVSRMCDAAGVDRELVDYLGEDGLPVLGVEQVVDAPSTAEGREKEASLTSLIAEYHRTGLTQSLDRRISELDVRTGFDALASASD